MKKRGKEGTEVIALRVPIGTAAKLKLAACDESSKRRTVVTWSALMRELINKVTASSK